MSASCFLSVLALFCAVGAQTLPLHTRALQTPVVTNSSNGVSFIGNSSNGVESFLNIRFGQDTAGQNRFAPPLPYTYTSNTVVNASAPGAACPQQKVPVPGISIFSNVTNYSEDCLTLRVDRPFNTTANAKLPVMVYIYGGGDTAGQIYDQAYDPTGLVLGAAAKKMPVIYAAMNYRLGLFGFAATEALREQNSLNLAYMDQRLGLDWIQKNIALFGGDPDNVTIFGESAGGAAVGLQITAYGGQQSAPFKRAIMESGSPTSHGGIASNHTYNHTAALINLVNCTSTNGNSSEELACLRVLPLTVLLPIVIDYELTVSSFAGFEAFQATVPSSFIPDNPSKLLRQGKFAKNIDIIAGWNENDASLFVETSIFTEKDFRTWAQKLLTPGISDANYHELLGLYPAANFQDDPKENVTRQYFRAAQADRDMAYSCPNLFLVQAMAKYSINTTTNYLFASNASLFSRLYTAENKSYLGISHFSDIPFVFNQASAAEYNATAADIQLSNEISGSWQAFARSGEPTIPGLDATASTNVTLYGWSQATSKNGTGEYGLRILGGPRDGMVHIGRKAAAGDLSFYGEDLARRCAFWNREDVQEQGGV